MESYITATDVASQYVPPAAIANSRYQADALVLEQTLPTSDGYGSDASIVSLSGTAQTLALSAEEILTKLNELLKDKLPNGVESLKPEDHTAEKTADTIVSGVTALFSKFLKSNPELSPEEALSHFMDAARSGVEQGYSSAYDTLEGLGAFEIDGVKSGIEQTKILISQKLDAFEAAQRKTLGIDDVALPTAELTSSNLLQQAGSSLNRSVAT